MTLNTGQILQQRYHIVSHVGQGGMGAVYQAQDMRLGSRVVAVKEFDPAQLPLGDRQIALQAFQQEAAILAKLSHPGLTAVTDYFAENNKFYLVMEFVEGETLQQAWERVGRRFDEAQVVTWDQELCAVLNYLHSQQPPIIFRDLKPGNIMVQPNGSLKLIDFGIARHFTPGKTSDTVKFGTPGYASPEQYGQGQTDARSDVYALGVVTHQLLTGYDPTNTPFHLPPITQLAPQVSASVNQAVTQALEMDPDKRPSTTTLFSQMLTVQPPAAKRPLWVWLGGVVLLLGITAVLLRLFLPSQSTPVPTATPSKPEPTARISTVIVTETPPPPTLAATTTAAADLEPSPTTAPDVVETVNVPETAVVPAQTSVAETASVAEPTTPPSLGSTRTAESDGMVQAYIPAGEFSMGDGGGNSDEKPVHNVYLAEYWLDQTEVSNEQFAQFAVATGHQTAAESAGFGWTYDGSWREVADAYWRQPQGAGSNAPPDHPVVQVSWYDAQAYCEWVGRRLPTEAEWEKAARSDDQRAYPWGDTFDGTRLNFCDANCTPDVSANDGYAGIAPVGSYPTGASPYGILDMAGNAFEWVADWYGGDYYANSPAQNPPGPADGQYKVMRGGSWQFGDNAALSTAREVSNPAMYNDSVGFRCAE